MKYFAYIVARDFGFAPNPFYALCTLATCKPEIRKQAEIDDWVFGLGSCALKCRGRLIYAMQVNKKMTYDDYWKDKRFSRKKPAVRGSAVAMHGDNIYHRGGDGEWRQEDSQHSYDEGKVNHANLDQDTHSDKVLVSDHFYYFGEKCIPLPAYFECHVNKMGPGFTYVPEKSALKLISRLKKIGPGYHGDPIQLENRLAKYSGKK